MLIIWIKAFLIDSFFSLIPFGIPLWSKPSRKIYWIFADGQIRFISSIKDVAEASGTSSSNDECIILNFSTLKLVILLSL